MRWLAPPLTWTVSVVAIRHSLGNRTGPSRNLVCDETRAFPNVSFENRLFVEFRALIHGPVTSGTWPESFQTGSETRPRNDSG
jgi:hypothetical protein